MLQQLARVTKGKYYPLAKPGDEKHERSEELSLRLDRASLAKTRRCSFTLHLQDENANVLGSVDHRFDLEPEGDLAQLLLRLGITVRPED